METALSRAATVTIVIAGLVILLDQVTKRVVTDRLIGGGGTGRFDLISSWLGFSYVENRGAAFGLLQERSEVLLVLAILVVIGIVFAYRQLTSSSMLVAGAIGLILGGALGNIFDRIRLGYVIDFVAVGPWPRFNVADASLTVGVIVFAGAVLFASDTSRPRAATEREGLGQPSE